MNELEFQKFLDYMPPKLTLTDRQWQEIAEAIGLKEADGAFRKRFKDCVGTARLITLVPTFGNKGGPKLGEARKILKQIHSAASKLEVALSSLQGLSDGGVTMDERSGEKWALNAVLLKWAEALENFYPHFWEYFCPKGTSLYEYRPDGDVDFYPSRILKNIEEFSFRSISKFVSDSGAIIQGLSDGKKGRPADIYLSTLIRELALLYHGQANLQPTVYWSDLEGRYDTPFFDFLMACIPAIEPELGKSPDAIGIMAQRTLKKFRSNPGKGQN